MVYPYSAAFYVGILFLTALLSVLVNAVRPVLKKGILVIIILFLSLCAGFRGESVGCDTLGYMYNIESCRPGYYGGVIGGMEQGFYLLIKSILLVFDNTQFVLIVIALLINTLIITRLWSLKDKISFSFAVFCYTALYYLSTYSGIRQWIAVAVVFYASKYVFEQKYGIFTIFVLIASTIHNSALIALIYIPLDMVFWERVPLKYKKIFLISVISSPLLLYGMFVLITKTGLISQYAHLLADDYKNINIGFSLFIKLAFIIFVVSLVKEKDYRFKDIYFGKKVILFYFVGVVLTFSGYFYYNISRIGWYFMVYEIVFFSMVSKTKRFGIVLKYAIVLVSLYLFYRNLKGSGASEMPYIPFWAF